MTLTTSSIKAVATGNAATTVWPFTFLIPALTDVIVTLVLISSGDETVLSPSTYTVSGLGVDTGGTVTYPLSGSPLAATYKIVIQRSLPILQETDLVNQGGAYPADIEDALDYSIMVSQQLQDQLDRSIVFSIADTGSDGTLPLAAARASKYLAFDSNGDPSVVDTITPGTTVSAAMIPVVEAPTTADALVALGITGGSALLDLIIPSGTCWDYDCDGPAPAGFVYPIGQPCTSSYPDYRTKLINIGSPYGTNGVDPLMPDRRSAVSACKSNMGGVDNGLLTGGVVLGAVLGTQTKTLIGANLPAYTPAGTVALATGSGLGSSTALFMKAYNGSNNDSNATAGTTGSLVAVTSNVALTMNAQAFTGTAQGGVSTPVSVVQPTFICNKILKVH